VKFLGKIKPLTPVCCRVLRHPILHIGDPSINSPPLGEFHPTFK
jgi:hypothetical protein